MNIRRTIAKLDESDLILKDRISCANNLSQYDKDLFVRIANAINEAIDILGRIDEEQSKEFRTEVEDLEKLIQYTEHDVNSLKG